VRVQLRNFSENVGTTHEIEQDGDEAANRDGASDKTAAAY
jgi:hypothetical protein